MRIVVSRAARHCPRILDEIKCGRLHLSGAYLLCKNVKEKELSTWFDKVQFKSKAEIESLLKTEHSFSQSRREYIKPVLRLEQKTNKPDLNSSSNQRSLFDGTINTPTNNLTPNLAVSAVPEASDTSKTSPKKSLDLKSPDFEIRIGITVKKEVYDNIKKLQRLTGKDKVSDVVEKAIEHYLESIDPEKKIERRKMRDKKKAKSQEINILTTFPETVNSQKSHPKSHLKNSRYIPQKVKEEVYLRDGGRCTFVTADGNRCEAIHHLEYDHLRPFAKGGEATSVNLVLKCHAHNFFAAEKAFGADFMKRYRRY